MAKVNENYLKLKPSYLFSEIAKRVNEFAENNKDKNIIRLGIGDVTIPLTNEVIKAVTLANNEMGEKATFRGYGPEQGYDFLRNKIVDVCFKSKGLDIAPDEIFVSDGSKSDTGNIGDIFGDNIVAITDPVYPVYVDTNIMAGRQIEYLSCSADKGFIPDVPDKKVDVIYICSPNNPTGTAMKKADLKKFVDYAIEHEAIILFDAAYEAYITEDDVPHSIYEIEGAKKVAIEFRSFSKLAGFTGTRCAFTVVPKELYGTTQSGEKVSINGLWLRRQTTKFNGVPYIIQRAAEAVYSEQGMLETKKIVSYYLENAKIIRDNLISLGFKVYGGVNAPYIWLETPNRMSSWEFFDELLNGANVVGTPGVGFGSNGEGYFRLTAFNSKENTVLAMERIKIWVNLNKK